MLSFIVTVIVTAVSLLILARISIGLDVDDTGSALVAALVLGLLNATLFPALQFLSIIPGFLAPGFLMPDFLTLGLFSFVLSAIVLYITAALVKGFHIRSFMAILISSILLGILNGLTFWILQAFSIV